MRPTQSSVRWKQFCTRARDGFDGWGKGDPDALYATVTDSPFGGYDWRLWRGSNCLRIGNEETVQSAKRKVSSFLL